MTTTYTDVGALRSYLGIHDGDDDTLLEGAIEAASRSIDAWCGRRFYLDETATARTFHPADAWRVVVDDFATTSGLIIRTDDTDSGSYATTWDAADYVLSPLNGEEHGVTGLPYTEVRAVGTRCFTTWSSRPTVEVTAQWGWTAVPTPVVRACLIKAARLYRRSQTPEGFAAGEAFGAIRVSSREDPDAVMLLAPYRRGGGNGLVVA